MVAGPASRLCEAGALAAHLRVLRVLVVGGGQSAGHLALLTGHDGRKEAAGEETI